MSLRPNRRKCRCCREFFFPDYRNQDRQQYCGKPACRQASQRASQQRWLRQPANRDYFRDSKNVQRVREWRQAHPGYWKRENRASRSSQAIPPQEVSQVQSSCNAMSSPLRTLPEVCSAKDPGFIGLISMITGCTLPEDIAATAIRVVEQGRKILGRVSPEPCNVKPCFIYDLQTSAPHGSATANPPEL
jgi:hypothetical protein